MTLVRFDFSFSGREREFANAQCWALIPQSLPRKKRRTQESAIGGGTSDQRHPITPYLYRILWMDLQVQIRINSHDELE